MGHKCADSEVQDEQAAVMDRLVWEPQLVDSLGSVHLKQVCYGKQAPHHCACSRHRALLSQNIALVTHCDCRDQHGLVRQALHVVSKKHIAVWFQLSSEKQLCTTVPYLPCKISIALHTTKS